MNDNVGSDNIRILFDVKETSNPFRVNQLHPNFLKGIEWNRVNINVR
ncbi:MAG: hypothetical protein ACI8RD_014324 [Bacillariaceae sp.]|jgi:hypothetical protein